MCAGEDIQIVKNINYGVRLDLKINNLIKKNLKKANKIIALNKGILKLIKTLVLKEKKFK